MTKTDILQGTLDMLVMRAVADEALHGYALAHRLRLVSGERLQIPQGSLYPALHRLENAGMLKSSWAPTSSACRTGSGSSARNSRIIVPPSSSAFHRQDCFAPLSLVARSKPIA